jgi:predicted sulfurtransferase
MKPVVHFPRVILVEPPSSRLIRHRTSLQEESRNVGIFCDMTDAINYAKTVKCVLKESRPLSLSRKQIVSAILNSREKDVGDQFNRKVERKLTKHGVKAALDELKTKGKVTVESDGTVKWANSKKRERAEDVAADGVSTTGTRDGKELRKKAKRAEVGRELAEDAAEIAAQDIVSKHESRDKSKDLPFVKPPPEQTTILLFYAYVDPEWNRSQQDHAIDFCQTVLSENDMTGRLRLGREGFNGTLTGSYDAVRTFVAALRKEWPKTFSKECGDCYNNFKYVDGLPASQRLKSLKVFPVTEIVTYGFNPKMAPLSMRGTHLNPVQWNEALQEKNTICLDVRNFNESLIGKFVPPGDKPITGAPGTVTDMLMRRSTDFAPWIEKNKKKLEGKKVLLYCTAGVRCERASAFLRNKGIDDVYQLDGGVHRYLEHFKEDGGLWKGKNYTFDKRFAHGADNAEIISNCVHCGESWERYQASAKCARCKMEVLLCRRCQRTPKPPRKQSLFCPICKPGGNQAGPQPLAPSKWKEDQKTKSS